MSGATVVLLLPGMTLNETIFPPLPFATIPATFNSLVLGPDGINDDLRSRRMAVFVDLLDQRLAHAPEWDRAGRRLVVGHSFGGMLALAWWLAHRGEGPARVDGIVLVATTAGPMFDVVRLRLGGIGSGELRLGIGMLMRLWNSPLLTRAIKRSLSSGMLEARPVDFQKLSARSDWALDFAGWRNTDWRAMRSYRQALVGFDVRRRLGEVNVPAIVLHGDADTLLPLDAAHSLAGALPDGELRIVPGAGHGLPLTHGAAVLRALEDVTRARR